MRDFIITETNWAFYGLLAQCISRPNEYVLAIRGTEDLTEWWDDLHLPSLSRCRASATSRMDFSGSTRPYG